MERLGRIFKSFGSNRHESIQSNLKDKRRLEEYQKREQGLLDGLDIFFEKQRGNADQGQTAITALFFLLKFLTDKIKLRCIRLKSNFYNKGAE